MNEIKQYDKLYKKTATGAIQVWWMEQLGGSYRSNSCQKDSDKVVTTEWTLVTGKNIGKKNETSDEEQAKSEILSEYKKKLAQGNYNESIDDIDSDNYFKPMLAKSLGDYTLTDKDFEKEQIYSQPKLDGVRLIASKNGLYSRNGKKFFSIPHIENLLKPLFDVNPNLVLDGELYNHQFRDNFNKIISLVKKTKPSKEDLEESEKYIQYWIYDCFDITKKKMIFSDRFSFLLENVLPSLLSFFSLSGQLKIVKTNLLKSKDEMYELYSKYVENGFEGQMIRIDGKPYENKRVNHLLKHKSFMDAEFTIISIEEGQGNRSGMAGYIRYKLPDNDKLFDSGIKADVDTLKQLLIDRAEYVGGQGTVKFFNYTPDGVPRFPVTISLFKGKRDV